MVLKAYMVFSKYMDVLIVKKKILYFLCFLKIDVLMFTHILRKDTNHALFFKITKFQCFLTDNLSINPINFIEICNFCIENIKKSIF